MRLATYLDHAASSPMRASAMAALTRHLSVVGNPSALHVAGQQARRALEEAREMLASAVGASPSEVVFTSGGSEADSIALIGGMAARQAEGRVRCLVSAIEHPAVLGMTGRGAEVLPVTREGIVDVGAAVTAIDADVGVVSIMAVNNETGICQPMEDIRRAARARGAWLHTDAVQALGHVPIDFRSSGLDMMTLSAHKAGGPVGIGALLVRRSVAPSMVGLGGGQERDIRSGTGAVALAASFAAAAHEATAGLAEESARLSAMQAQITAASRELDGDVNSDLAESAPHITNVTFRGVRANDVLFLLDQRGVFASVGSACRAGVHQPSEVLLAMGRTPDEAAATLRFSTGHSTTDADVDRFLEVLPLAVRQARNAF
ncbi:MAG: cysteine desulfurase family protein [Propionibacteriaceae bacterium]|nr:cysteine desulfurase family protein [Propionibacteriaceae bacterium]